MIKVIDFHTHIFPDKIAEKAVENLKKSSGYENAIGGRYCDLTSEMEKAKVSLSVNLPILTNVERFESTLSKLVEENNQQAKVLSFAPIHPLMEDLNGAIDLIVSNSFKGIKIHPFFQGVNIDDDCVLKTVELAEKKGLITVIHTGLDASFSSCDVASVDRIINLLEQVKHEKLVLAHMGAMDLFQESFERLSGRDVYFDTSFSLGMGEDLFTRIVKKHTADKILFGTDSPWVSQVEYVKKIKELALTDLEKEKIFYKNACKLLDLEI